MNKEEEYEAEALFLAHMIKSSRRRFFQQQFFDWGCE
jgi:hypothetical protein